MRALVLIAILLLAGCADSPPPTMERPDPTTPIYGGLEPEALQQFGPQANGTTDADVLVAKCGDNENVFAYSIPGGGAVRLSAPRGVPNATQFLVASFTDGPDGLVEHSVWRGGFHAKLAPDHEYRLASWHMRMPEDFTIQSGSDEIARIAIACKGEGVVNYVVGVAREPSAPNYLEPVIATGFDSFLALGSEFGTINFPPGGTSTAVWSQAGNVNVTFTESIPEGVRMGDTRIQWSGPPGWSTATCMHSGISDHGEWSYSADLHGDVREAADYMADDLATLGLVQTLVLGDIYARQVHDGSEPATLDFHVKHMASSRIGWVTECEGAHLSATLPTLFGMQAASSWMAGEPWV